jgi:hypothetical protein
MRCWGLQKVANAAYKSGFLCSGLPYVAPYCVRGGIRVVSIASVTRPSRRVSLANSSSNLDSSRASLMHRKVQLGSSITPSYDTDSEKLSTQQIAQNLYVVPSTVRT